MTEYQLPKAYDFKSTEPRIYEMWEKGGYFKPSNDPNKPDFDPSKKPFVISIPPPNVTGELHLGHVMFVAMEDLMIRYQRMKGVPSLWVPGTDHAGIATQLQVEKDLLHTEEVTRAKNWAVRSSSNGSGPGRSNITASSRDRSARSAPRVTGIVSASPLMMACRKRYGRLSCDYMRKG